MCKKLILSALVVSAVSMPAWAAILQCDAGTGTLQSGWTQIVAGLNTNVAGTGIDVTLATGNPGAIAHRGAAQTGGGSGPLAAVEEDLYFANDEISSPGSDFILTLSNLPVGNYLVKSYHNRSNESATTIPAVTVTGATNVIAPSSIVQDHPIMDTPAEILFTADGLTNVVIRYQGPNGGCPGCQALFNGFELELAGSTVQFDTSASGNLESVTPAQLAVSLSESQIDTITVSYAVTGGTADGADYTVTPSPLIFSPGQTNKTIDITIVNDGADEENETIEVTLTGATGGEVTLGSITQHTYTIIDPRPDVQFQTPTSIGAEDTSPANVAVSLSHTWAQTVTVDYSVTGGSAANGVDYTLADGTLIFDPCQTTKNIAITIIDDPCQEGPETIELTLSDPNKAKLGPTAQHTFTIDDDELGSTFTNSLGMEFVLIMPGTFTMGQGDGHRIQDAGDLDYDEQPAHLVTITKPFYFLKNRVATSHYEQGIPGGDANDVSWDDANSFVAWLSAMDGRDYNLPTEAQWQHVYENPGPVTNMGSREWVRDWHDEYPHNSLTDPTGPVKGILKVIRDDGQNRWSLPTNAKYDPWQLPEAGPCGFRLVFEHDPPEKRDVLVGPFCQAAVKQSTAGALQGPDPCVPYFTVRFSMPIPPDNSNAGLASMLGCDPIVTAHNHSPGFEILPNGDALTVWFTGGGEYGPEVRFCQARLRYGSDQWDLPEILYDMKRMNDTSGLLWTEADGTIRFFGGGRITNSERRPFVMAASTDSAATWDLKQPYFPISATSFTAQPCQNAWRQNGTTIFMITDGSGSQSVIWRSTDNGINWYDMGGRTNGRHSTIVPVGNSGTLLSYGGKNSDISGWMPWNKSYNWGATWPDEGPTVFSPLGSNQRPCLIRMANGKLAFCCDAQHKNDYKPPGSTYDYGCVVGISDNNGLTWTIKNLPVTLPHESDRDYGTLGYSTIRQAPSGVIHIHTTMTHPCLHYELNEAWIFSGDGDIPPETTGGTVNPYSENYPSGPLKATWSARTCPNGRYLLHGTETSYYEDGTTEHQANYVNGRKSGIETFWAPDATILWSWDHNDSDNTSVWTHYWANGLKRLESRWDTYPAPRDLPGRNFSGFVGDGTAYHWSLCGQPEKAYNFSDGGYLGETALPEPQAAIIADITGDCAVDGKDLKVLVGDWLETGQYVPTVPPNDTELVLFYDFNESSGYTLTDSSGNSNDGYFITDVDWTLGDITGRMDPGRSGNSFHFWPGLATAGIYIPDNLFSKHNITQQITVAVWIRNAHPSETPDSGAFMWEFRQWDGMSTTSGPRVLAVETVSENGEFRFHDDSQNVSTSIDWSDHTEWTHYAFVRDSSYLKLYVNGQPRSQGSSSGNPMAVPALLYCGVSADRAPGNPSGLHDGFTGNMDEFKIYRYALADDEVLHIAFDGNAYLPLDSPANLYDDEIIDGKDYSIIASQWGQSLQ